MTELENLILSRASEASEAGLWLCSLPWPRHSFSAPYIGGAPTHHLPLGRWSSTVNAPPRRVLLFADANNTAPKTLKLSTRGRQCDSPAPHATNEVFESSDDADFPCDRSLLRICFQGCSLAMGLGLRVKGDLHWWEACRLVIHNDGPHCRIIEMAGAIPVVRYSRREYANFRDASFPFLHRHNWIYGKIYARLHANGVCEIFARHLNSRFVDHGADFHNAVPIIGFHSSAAREPLGMPWTGECCTLRFGDACFDLSQASTLVSASQPGRMDTQGGMLVWQPYEGMELYCGAATHQRSGDPFSYRSADHVVPNGMARTIRFSFSLSDRSPVIARYLAPASWYGLCQEFLPEPLLPDVAAHPNKYHVARAWIHSNITSGSFEDGSIPRTNNAEPDNPNHPRHEAGWEGDIAYGLFLAAWLRGDGKDLDVALRAAYHFADVAVDHSSKLVRMHGWPPGTFALPMNRVLSLIVAFLENGDPYLLDTARSVIDNAFWMHRDAWPRLAVGRDACFARGALMLYRYFSDQHYADIGQSVVRNVIAVQLPSGNFGDQGGGTGIHQRNSYVEKPWMGTLAIIPVIDYLELFPEDQVAQAAVLRFGDWLLAERVNFGTYRGWCYQHGFNGGRTYLPPGQSEHQTLPGPRAWQQESLARILGWCSLATGDARYLEAWLESHLQTPSCSSDHAVSAALQFLPWLNAKLEHATKHEGTNESILEIYRRWRSSACEGIRP
jgi:hypothetical protein